MKLPIWFFPVLVLLSNGCSSLIQKPDLEVQQVRFLQMDFDSVQLAVDVKVHNPNQVAIQFAGFDYAVNIQQNALIQGEQNTPQRIEAQGESRFEVPVRLQFQDLIKIVQDLWSKDKIAYQVLLGLDFDLPILGAVHLPLEHNGEIPIPKLPTLQVKALTLTKVSLTQANLELELMVQNPNSFGMTLKEFQYSFSVQGQNWLEGISQEMTLDQKQERPLMLPISLNFLQLGRAVYSLVTGNNPLSYQLTGNFVLQISLPFFQKDLRRSIELSNEIQVTKN